MNRQWFVVSLMLLAVVVALRLGTILEHRAWSGGKSTVMGHMDDVQQSFVNKRYMYTMKYSYTVAGKPYQGEFIDARRFPAYGPVDVTYAKSNPAVSTILPDEIDSKFRTSVILVVLAALWPIGMLLSGIRKKPAQGLAPEPAEGP
jgi:hypothetical protein